MEQAQTTNWNAWSAQEDAKLRELAESGMPYSEIAVMIGRGRNSCIGRAHRLGIISTWTKPAKSATPSAVKQRAKAVIALFPPRPRPVPAAKAAPAAVAAPTQDNRPVPLYPQPEASTTPFGKPLTLMQLEPHHCRWPVSGERNDTLFCGAVRETMTRPYCTEHHLLAWRPPADKRDLSRIAKAYR